MAGLKIKKGDRVQVLTGKDKGATGTVIKALPREGKVLVEGVNVVKKHQKPTRMGAQGGIQDKIMPIDVSNVAVVDPKDGHPTRFGYRVDADGTKVRVSRRTGVELP